MKKIMHTIASMLLLVSPMTASAFGPYGPFDPYAPAAPLGSFDPFNPIDPIGPGGPGPFFNQGFNQDKGLQYEKEQTEEAYILKIHLKNMKPSDIDIHPTGHGVVIRSARAFHRENQNDRGSYSYISSSSSFSKYIRVPGDADLNQMQRTDNEGTTIITIPRTNRYDRY